MRLTHAIFWLRVQVRRHRAACMLFVLITAVVTLISLSLRQQRANAAHQKLEIAQLENRLQKLKLTAGNDGTEAIEQFEDLLLPQQHLQEALQSLHGIEVESGLVITNANYKLRALAHENFAAIEMQFLTKSDYRSVRTFVEKLLLALPFASVSELVLKRDQVQNNQIDVRCKISFFVTTRPLPKEGLGGME